MTGAALYGSDFTEETAGISWSASRGTFCRYDRVPTNRRHSHDYYELCFIRSGKGVFHHGEKEYPLSRGSVIVSDPVTIHEISSLETRDLELIFFRLDLKRKENYLPSGPEEEILFRFMEKHNHAARGEHLLDYIPLLSPQRDGVSRSFGSRRAVRSLILEGLEILTPRKETKHNPLLDKALALIESKLTEKLTIETLAKEVGVSERHLRRLFNECFGMKVIDVIHDRRMAYADQLLRMNWRVGEVAEVMGYDDQGQFSRLFKQCRGVAPSHVRNRHNTVPF